MRLVICLTVLSLTTAQDIVFPGQNDRNPQSNSNSQKENATENKLSALLGNSVRNGVPPISAAPGSNACTTPSGEAGLCGPISLCPSYLPLLRQLDNANTLTFLRGRICRILPRSLQFCCPTNSFPTNTEGPGDGTRGSVPIPNEDECGLPSAEKVIGGAEAEIGVWPWATAVGIPIENNGFQSLCGGSLITRRHVLSAAHCFASDIPEELRTHVRVGEHNLVSDSDGLRPQDIRILSRRSTGYDAFTKANDIELLILEEEAVFNDFVKPVCLPMSPSLRNNFFENQTATVVGWGRFSFENDAPATSDVLMEADVPVVPLGPCSDVYRSRTRGAVVDQRTICAGRGPTDACGGDSGGPLNYNNPENSRFYIIGIVSHGVGCGFAEFPGVYTRVGAFMNWIVSNIQSTIV